MSSNDASKRFAAGSSHPAPPRKRPNNNNEEEDDLIDESLDEYDADVPMQPPEDCEEVDLGEAGRNWTRPQVPPFDAQATSIGGCTRVLPISPHRRGPCVIMVKLVKPSSCVALQSPAICLLASWEDSPRGLVVLRPHHNPLPSTCLPSVFQQVEVDYFITGRMEGMDTNPGQKQVGRGL